MKLLQGLDITDQTIISDIKGALTVGVIIDYLHLWDVLSDFFFQPDVEDRHTVLNVGLQKGDMSSN